MTKNKLKLRFRINHTHTETPLPYSNKFRHPLCNAGKKKRHNGSDRVEKRGTRMSKLLAAIAMRQDIETASQDRESQKYREKQEDIALLQ